MTTWTEYPNHDDDDRTPSAYDLILKRIRKRGDEAACGHYRTPPQPPYKRRDFRDAWQCGFDDATKHIEAAMRELDESDWDGKRW